MKLEIVFLNDENIKLSVSSNTRVDPFTSTHKGLRNVINKVQVWAGRLDYANTTQLEEFSKEFKQLWQLLHIHSDGEDKFLFPMLDKIDHENYDLLEAEHNAIDPIMEKMEKDLAKIPGLSEDKRKAVGKKFVYAYNEFVAMYYNHLQTEERLLPLFWDNFSDAELGAAIAKFPSLSPPEITKYFAGYLLEALNNDERTGFLMGMKMNAPEPVFQLFSNTAEKVLETEDWNIVKDRLGL